MGELSFDVIDRAMPVERSPYVLAEGSRPSQLRHGHAVPLSERNVVEVDVQRGSFLQVGILACAHCPATYVVRSCPPRDMPRRARGDGWSNSRSSWGWLCVECTALFGVES